MEEAEDPGNDAGFTDNTPSLAAYALSGPHACRSTTRENRSLTFSLILDL